MVGEVAELFEVGEVGDVGKFVVASWVCKISEVN